MRYHANADNAYANARFLGLSRKFHQDGATKSVKCETAIEAQAALRTMVEELAIAFD